MLRRPLIVGASRERGFFLAAKTRIQPQFKAGCRDCRPDRRNRSPGKPRKNMWMTPGRSLIRTLLAVGLAASGLAVTVAGGARDLSLQEAVIQAQHETDGRVLSVQTLNVGKRKVYRIKILTRDGRVRVIQVAADQ
jgi:hypothetical protein